jgi:hypothetical protein
MAKPTAQQRAKVIDNPALERDLSSNAVINKDTSAYHHRMAHRKAHSSQCAEIKSLRDDVAKLTALVQTLLPSSK